MEEKNRASFLTGLVFVLLGWLANSVLHGSTISNSFNDIGITRSLPCLLLVIGFSLIVLLKSFRYPALVILAISIVAVLYEVKQYYISGNLDIKNIIASVIGGAIALLIWLYIEKRFANQDK